MDGDEIRAACRSLLERADAVYVTTVDPDDYPYTRAMFNLRNATQFPRLVEVFEKLNDEFMVYLTTNTSSKKIVQIKANPKAALYYCVPGQFHGLMLSGELEIVDDARVREMLWQDGWEQYYPLGCNDPDHMVLCLRPKKARGWFEGTKFEFELE